MTCAIDVDTADMTKKNKLNLDINCIILEFPLQAACGLLRLENFSRLLQPEDFCQWTEVSKYRATFATYCDMPDN